MAKERTNEEVFAELFGGEQSNGTEDDSSQENEELSEEVDQEELEEPSKQEEQEDDEGEPKEEPREGSQEPDYQELLEIVQDPEKQKLVQHLIQSERSNKGRVSALTKKIDALQQYYQNAVAQQESAKSQPARSEQAPASAAAPSGEAAQEPELPQEVAALKEKSPMVYAAFKKLIESELAQKEAAIAQRIDERVKPVEDSYRKEANQREAQRLEEMAGRLFDVEKTGLTVRDVISSSDFSMWLRGQPPRIRELYKSAQTADEAMLILNKFNTDIEYLSKIEEELDPPAKDDTSSDTQQPGSSKKGDELKARRAAQKKKSVVPASKTAVTDASDVGDYEALFDSFWGDKGKYKTKRNV